MENTTILRLPLIQGGQAQKHVTHNEALRRLDALVQPVVADIDRTEPPADPVDGARHVVAAGATGEWANQSGRIAVREGPAWRFIDAAPGWRVHARSLGADVTFDGTAWSAGGASAVETLGVNAAADATNRLVVRAAATLLDHEGAGHRLKVNRADVAETASLLFQSDFSGRAEMGIAGEDAFSVKVSADGAAWTTALRLDAATGSATGAAVQADAEDVAGKLARTDWTYGMGNAVAPVAMEAGRPSGGLMERGGDASGRFARRACGSLACTHALRLDRVDDDTLRGDWTCPAPFDGGEPDAVTASIDHASVAAGTVQGLGAVTHERLGGSQVAFRVHRARGAPVFAAGASVTLLVTATGRWA